MKLLSIVPLRLGRPSLGTLLETTERRLRGTSTTFRRQKKRQWSHAKYGGRITWDVSKNGILEVEIRSPESGLETQLLQAFIGYLDRHLGDELDSITILYYPD